jgi:hypothetical protein
MIQPKVKYFVAAVALDEEGEAIDHGMMGH